MVHTYKKIKQKNRGTTHITLLHPAFKVRRFFYIENVPLGEVRGKHANKKTNQHIICTSGKVRIMKIAANGEGYFFYTLSAGQSTPLPKMYWVEMEFLQKNSTLLVLADREYDPAEYITDHNTFLNEY